MFGRALMKVFLPLAVTVCAGVAQADTITHGSTTIDTDS